MLLSGSAWREKLEHAEVRKQEETEELQVVCFFAFEGIIWYNLSNVPAFNLAFIRAQ